MNSPSYKKGDTYCNRSKKKHGHGGDPGNPDPEKGYSASDDPYAGEPADSIFPVIFLPFKLWDGHSAVC